MNHQLVQFFLVCHSIKKGSSCRSLAPQWPQSGLLRVPILLGPCCLAVLLQVSFALAYLLYKAELDRENTAVVLETDVMEGVSTAITEVVPYFTGVRNR